MMQAGVCLRQDTETTLPEFTEQHGIRQKEEELNGLESVHMAESETEWSAPGLNTLEPECVTAHSGVTDVHHTHASLIKTETDLVSTHAGDLMKTESFDCTELGYATHLLHDQIKTEADDGGYLVAEHISDLEDIKCVDIRSNQMKCESSESLVSDLNNCVMTGALDQSKPWQCAGELNTNCKEEKMQDLFTQRREFNHHSDAKNENNSTRVVLKTADGNREHLQCQRTTMAMEPVCKTPQSNLLQTEAIHGQKGEIHTGEKPYKCIHCHKCLTTNYALKLHLRIHTGEKPYKCTHCGKSFHSKSNLCTHQKIHSGEKPYECIQCGKCFSLTHNLRVHQRTHTDEKPYKCAQCGKLYKRHASLQLHLKIHTGENLYMCTVCEKSFYSKSNLYKHQRIHTGEKPYKCPLCEKRYSERYHLTVHRRIHTGEKPYECLQCGKRFSQSCHLSAHQKIHTGEKPYACKQCGKRFSLTHNLSVHQRIHTGERPYKCTQCDKCYRRRADLQLHLKIHTGENPYMCTVCGKCFYSKSNLQKHQKIHTDDKPSKRP